MTVQSVNRNAPLPFIHYGRFGLIQNYVASGSLILSCFSPELLSLTLMHTGLNPGLLNRK